MPTACARHYSDAPRQKVATLPTSPAARRFHATFRRPPTPDDAQMLRVPTDSADVLRAAQHCFARLRAMPTMLPYIHAAAQRQAGDNQPAARAARAAHSLRHRVAHPITPASPVAIPRFSRLFACRYFFLMAPMSLMVFRQWQNIVGAAIPLAFSARALRRLFYRYAPPGYPRHAGREVSHQRPPASAEFSR